MAYNVENYPKLRDLKALAQRVEQDFATKQELNTLSGRVDQLVTAGGEPNVITAVKVNGTALPITDKAVDIGVPGYTIEKAADSGEYAAIYQLKKDGVAAGPAINIPKDMVVQDGSVVTNPEGQAAGTYIKLVLQNVEEPLFIDVGGLIEYVTSGSVEGDMVVIAIDDTTHKVTATITDGTITKAKLAAALVTEIEGKVDKVEGKVLSSNDYTTEEKTKLAGVAAGATKVEASTTNGNVKVNGVETTVYTEPEDVLHGSAATAAEVEEMLNEVFGTTAAE